MTLLAQKVDQPVLSVGDFIKLRAHVSKQPLSAYLVEIDGQNLGKLLHKVVHWLDFAVEKGRNVTLEKVRIPDASACQSEIYYEA